MMWLFSFVVTTKNAGWAQCSLSNIGVSLSKTGRFVVNKPEWEVIISNNCVCSQSDLKLQCNGFTSAEQVDPVVFRKIDGQYCLVNAGLPVFQGQPISFKYAGDVMYDLPPAGSQINCS